MKDDWNKVSGNTDGYMTASLGEGLRDFVRDVPWAITWLVADNPVWGNESGDQQVSPKVADAIENFWDKYIKGDEFEFRMANGWRLPDGMKFNGQERPDIRNIDSLTSVFFKNPQGQVEVLDSDDPRWGDVVGPYMATQLLTVVATMGGGVVINGLSKGGTAAKVAGTGLKTAGMMEAGGSIGYLGSAITDELVLKPRAIEDLGKIFHDQKNLDPENLRDCVNKVLKQYSHDRGTMTEQFYIPSLREESSNLAIWKQLEDISKSRIPGFMRETPFDEITDFTENNKRQFREAIPINGGVIEGLKKDLRFQKNLLDTEIKAFSGHEISDKDTATLRFSSNILNATTFSLNDGTFSAQEKVETLDKMRLMITSEIRQGELEKEMKQQGASSNQIIAAQLQLNGSLWESVLKNGDKSVLEPDSNIVKYLEAKEDQVSAALDKRAAAEEASRPSYVNAKIGPIPSY